MKLAFEGTFPGERGLVAAFDYAARARETMDPDIRRGFDALNLAVAKAFWRALGVEI
jgi:hypothetical protein